MAEEKKLSIENEEGSKDSMLNGTSADASYDEGRSEKEAQDIDAYYSKMIPKAKPDLKEVFKDGYEEKMGLYQNGVKSISDDLKDRISETGLDKDPVFVEIMSRVGKETGGKPFNEIRKPDNVKRKSDPAMDAVRKSYERYYGRK